MTDDFRMLFHILYDSKEQKDLMMLGSLFTQCRES